MYIYDTVKFINLFLYAFLCISEAEPRFAFLLLLLQILSKQRKCILCVKIKKYSS